MREYTKATWRRVSVADRKSQMQDLLQAFALHPCGAALLNLAAVRGYRFAYDASLIDDKQESRALCDFANRVIFLRPMRDQMDLLNSLAHELRHVWQQERLGVSGADVRVEHRSLRDYMIITRVLEADAFAFADCFLDGLERGLRGGRKNFAANCMKEMTADKMEIYFCDILSGLSQYDIETAQSFHRRYTYPGRPPLSKKPGGGAAFLSLSDLRRCLVAGVGDTPAYFATMPDLRFGAIIADSIDRDYRRVMRLVDQFEKAARRLRPAQKETVKKIIHRSIGKLRLKNAI